MFEIENEFSKSIVAAFMNRVRFILNKIEQKNVVDFKGNVFFWEYYEECDTATIHSLHGDVVFLCEDFLSNEPRYYIDSYPLTKLHKDDNLSTFTTIEQEIIAELIKMEKAAIDIQIPTFEHRECEPGQETLGQFIASQKPLEKEFADVLYSNLTALYETEKK